MHPHQGRGAPEIDIFEVMPGHEMPGRGPINPFMSSSLQVSPGIDGKRYRRPVNGRQLNSSYTWYDGIEMDPERSEFNYGFWGQECGPVIDKSIGRVHKYMEDAISVNTQLNATHFEKQHRYAHILQHVITKLCPSIILLLLGAFSPPTSDRRIPYFLLPFSLLPPPPNFSLSLDL